MKLKEVLLDTENKMKKTIEAVMREFAEVRMKKTIEAVMREFAEVRTGRAHPSLVEGLYVDYYGSPMLLKQIASISIPEANLIVIQPWDPSVISEIEKAILKSNLGITPYNDGKIIRLVIPPLSRERREELAKLVRKMAEEGRVSLRTIRHTAKEAIEKLEKDKVISEDDKFRGFEELQKLIDKYISQIDNILKGKEKEIFEF
ncbi:MAG: ribosome recycling factor [Candidatus Omnitrophica bacterium]|nr:ribosome recycling factor [Candidatus Omnitrophota bacterium]